jgi:hypothetical protein
MGWSAGFTLRYEGGVGMSRGSWRETAAMAACTSWAAASMSRSRLNWMVMFVEPRLLVLVMLSMPAIVVNCFSSGVATAAAMVSGLAPGKLADTEIVGKSTVGRSLTGSRRYPRIPATMMAAMTRVVMTGLRMKMFIWARSPAESRPDGCLRRTGFSRRRIQASRRAANPSVPRRLRRA